MNTTFDKSKNSNRPEFFTRHKDYFDEKLINVLVATQDKCDKLTEEINKLRERIVADIMLESIVIKTSIPNQTWKTNNEYPKWT